MGNKYLVTDSLEDGKRMVRYSTDSAYYAVERYALRHLEHNSRTMVYAVLLCPLAVALTFYVKVSSLGDLDITEVHDD